MDHRSGGRCSCPFSIVTPGTHAGTTRLVRHDGPVTAARAERRRLMAEERPPPASPAHPENPSVRDLATQYLTTRDQILAPNTIANIATDYRLRIDPMLGAAQVQQLSRETIELFVARLVRTSTSRRMVVGTVASLRAILSAAVDWGYIDANPAARLRLPVPEHHETQSVERVLGRDELARLVQACHTLRIETLIRMGAEAGLRRGEVIGPSVGRRGPPRTARDRPAQRRPSSCCGEARADDQGATFTTGRDLAELGGAIG